MATMMMKLRKRCRGDGQMSLSCLLTSVIRTFVAPSRHWCHLHDVKLIRHPKIRLGILPRYQDQFLTDIWGSSMPSPLKYFCAPSHQILAKSAPKRARNRDKANFATKVRESSMNIWGTFDSKSLFKGGTFDPLSLILKCPGGIFEHFTTTKSV